MLRGARVERKRWHVIDGGTRVEVTEFQGFVIFLKFSTSFSLGNGGFFTNFIVLLFSKHLARFWDCRSEKIFYNLGLLITFARIIVLNLE